MYHFGLDPQRVTFQRATSIGQLIESQPDLAIGSFGMSLADDVFGLGAQRFVRHDRRRVEVAEHHATFEIQIACSAFIRAPALRSELLL